MRYLFLTPDTFVGVTVFHAGTALNKDGQVVTAGGRVLAVTATAPTLEGAVKKSYEGVAQVHFEGAQFRRDIAHRYALCFFSCSELSFNAEVCPERYHYRAQRANSRKA
jgi:hypothetical protein